MNKYQGEDIEFAVKLTHESDNDLKSFDECKRVVVYAYTHESHIVKFSNVKTDVTTGGYKPLVKSGDKQFVAIIPSADTKIMSGNLMIDVYIEPKVGNVEQIRSVQTGIQICFTPIKAETK